MHSHFSLGNEENLCSLSASQHMGSLRYPLKGQSLLYITGYISLTQMQEAVKYIPSLRSNYSHLSNCYLSYLCRN